MWLNVINFFKINSCNNCVLLFLEKSAQPHSLWYSCSGDDCWGECGGSGVAHLLDGLGTFGWGQVLSCALSGQNGLIFSNKHHCRSQDYPFGTITCGSLDRSASHGSFSSSSIPILIKVVWLLLHMHHSRLCWVEPEVMELLNPTDFLQPWSKEVRPVVDWHNCCPILMRNKLRNIANSWLLNYACDDGYAANFRPPIEPLEETKTPVGCEFGVPNY